MSEKEFNVVFSKRLRYYLNKYDMTQSDLAKRLGVGATSVYNWCNGIKSPRMDKVDAMCNIFNCRRFDLMEEKSHNQLEEIDPMYIAKDDTERRLLVLCRKASDANPEEKEAIINCFENFIDIFLKAKGIK